MKRLPVYERAWRWAERQARLIVRDGVKRSVTVGWLSVCLRVAWEAGYAAAKRKRRPKHGDNKD